MDHESWDVDCFQILSLIRLRECLDAIVSADDGDHHPLQPEGFTNAVGDFRSRLIIAIKGKSQILEELRAVVDYVSADILKNRERQATRILLSLEHQWRHRGDENGLKNSLLPMSRDVTDDLAPASGMREALPRFGFEVTAQIIAHNGGE